MTKVINLLGGSGLGKSTLAAGLFHAMKTQGLHAELVREYVKMWAWEGTKIGQFDQIYITGKQARAEYRLYHKLDYLVTDSPIVLAPIYEEFYLGDSIVLASVKKFLDAAKKAGIQHMNFLLARNKPFDSRGRYETEETALRVDAFVRAKLMDWEMPFTEVTCADADRVDFILKAVA